MNIQPIEKYTADPSGRLAVHSIFYTIQGEGPFCGQPAVFIRLAGCNLQCPSCDTIYTGDVVQTLRPLEVLERVRDVRTSKRQHLVVITGGEPFRQENIVDLVEALQLNGFTVQIETNGTLPVPAGFDPRKEAYIVVSPKTGKVNPSIANRACAWKYVISYDSVDASDGLPILALDHTAVPRVARPASATHVYVQPKDAKDEVLNERNLQAAITSCMTFGYTLQLQIHKIANLD